MLSVVLAAVRLDRVRVLADAQRALSEIRRHSSSRRSQLGVNVADLLGDGDVVRRGGRARARRRDCAASRHANAETARMHARRMRISDPLPTRRLRVRHAVAGVEYERRVRGGRQPTCPHGAGKGAPERRGPAPRTHCGETSPAREQFRDILTGKPEGTLVNFLISWLLNALSLWLLTKFVAPAFHIGVTSIHDRVVDRALVFGIVNAIVRRSRSSLSLPLSSCRSDCFCSSSMRCCFGSSRHRARLPHRRLLGGILVRDLDGIHLVDNQRHRTASARRELPGALARSISRPPRRREHRR